MSTNSIETEKTTTPEPSAPQAKGKRAAATKAKAAKKAKPARKAVAKRVAERSNKKAEVVVLMKRAKGATLTEIVEATGWQKHTVRGFVSILGSKGGEKIESSNNASGERVYKITILRAIASSDLHNLVYRSDYRIVPAVAANPATSLDHGAKATLG